MAVQIANETKEPCLSIDEFNKPRILKNRDAISTLLIHLILLEPGTYFNRPEMGVGLVSRYRDNDEESLTVLQKDIQDQITTYLPEFEAVDVKVYMDDTDYETKGNQIIIDITIDGTIYKYETSEQENNKIGLIDLKV